MDIEYKKNIIIIIITVTTTTTSAAAAAPPPPASAAAPAAASAAAAAATTTIEFQNKIYILLIPKINKFEFKQINTEKKHYNIYNYESNKNFSKQYFFL